VYAANLYNVPVVLKLPPSNEATTGSRHTSDDASFTEFMHEARAYQALRALQGGHIPRLIAYGTFALQVGLML
jgi:hypothetical protein